MGFVVRQMQPEEIQLAVGWAAAEGWNPGQFDATTFYNTDPAGFFIGELDGEPIACISGVTYGQSYGFVGFYIVKPEFRGQGYGLQTWNGAITYLKSQSGRIFGLDGVVEQQHNYERSGFRLAHRNSRFQGQFFENFAVDPHLVAIQDVAWEELLAFDRQFFPAERGKFLQAWFQQPQTLSYAYVDSALKGYGAIRPAETGWRIGPLFAVNYPVAERIFRSLVAHTQGAACFLDIPLVNPDAVKLVEVYQMTPMFETGRMYTPQAPPLNLKGLYGITSLELG
ncbi:GNAT family N-acetyltransferase [Synechococcus sp. PCC 6312]|uniref:GNAT family N-acetyltransferase n=1 Tax=Synechococcus sp. (strain ATCC 27167 / PCC 6312) TaxID=195253 RepID=UPI00029F0D29|nr:GNAT family N-acetyltransferase [Synechococcus sp. PCC 6312]AFY62003.1 acetyltransferase (GNAT) family protein [Synechococcus sp. PCC 6312]